MVMRHCEDNQKEICRCREGGGRASFKMLATLSQGGAAPDAAQDTAMSGGNDKRRTIPRETEDDEERTKRLRGEEDRTGDGKCQAWRRSMTGDEFWTYDATDGSWKTSDT